MTIQQVEWVLVIRYTKAAHQAIYGRFTGSKYTKDYIQLYRTAKFVSDLTAAFPEIAEGDDAIALDFQWPSGAATGKLFPRSADRPHLTWGTKEGAPPPWKMSLKPSPSTVETILGDPEHTDAAAADHEYAQLASTGFGQPFLVAVKLRQETHKLHLRVHVEAPASDFQWASIDLAPLEIQNLAASTRPSSVLAWRLFGIDGDTEALYFDPSKKANPWATEAMAEAKQTETSIADGSSPSGAASSSDLDNDASAETLPLSDDEVSAYEELLKAGNFHVPDSSATVKTRGSAQRVFAREVKKNYANRCALTGIKTRKFLIASHIVPWSIDETIRLDPSNGICLSVLVDRAFEIGFLIIEDDLTVKVDWEKVSKDDKLKKELLTFDGAKLTSPTLHPPKVEYLQRRRKLN